MKSSNLLLQLFVFLFVSTLARLSYADFGEIDLMVRESVEAYFNKDSHVVALDGLLYSSAPKSNENILIISTSIWATKQLEPADWQPFLCTTEIEIKGRNHYLDHGTLCIDAIDE